MTYTLFFDPGTGKLLGVTRSDGAFVPKDPTNADWRAFLAWNAQQQTPLVLADGQPTAMVPRTLVAIYQALVALTNTQKTNIWNDLGAGSPAKYLTDNGSEPGAIAVLDWTINQTGATFSAAAILDAKLRVTAVYVRDNPTYLVAPAFDPTINVPGQQLI